MATINAQNKGEALEALRMLQEQINSLRDDEEINTYIMYTDFKFKTDEVDSNEK